ncbi:3475_t:CDS:10 [Ambispora gerdemannii]|uniref:3475_t:CDS:1 n=1 Tax=Ambispora gerdemannii TaxID=144530 RepID=A0A9N9FJS4_9GLOM|nr:3475_t:CDS:10 [Ambispora gerdemannii]
MSQILPVDRGSCKSEENITHVSKETAEISNEPKLTDNDTIPLEKHDLTHTAQDLSEKAQELSVGGDIIQKPSPVTPEFKAGDLTSKDETLITKQITQVPLRDNELHPKKRIALATQPQQHNSHRGAGRYEKRQSQNPIKFVEKLVEHTNAIIQSPDDFTSPAFLFMIQREWLPKYANVLLSRSYPDLSYHLANTIHEFFNNLLDITVLILNDPEMMGVKYDDFPISEHLSEVVYRIIGDENAAFYRRFDGRNDSSGRPEVGPSGMYEFEDNNNSEMVGIEQLDSRMSQYQVNSIKHLIAKGGMHAMMRALGNGNVNNREGTEPYSFNIDLKDIYGLVKIIHKLTQYLVHSNNFNIMEFRECVFEVALQVQKQIKGIPDETLYRQDKKLFINIIHIVHHIITMVPSTSQVQSVVRDEANYHAMISSEDEDDDEEDPEVMLYQDLPDEQQILTCCFLRLDVASRLLRAPRLDLRLTGLTEIKDLLIFGLKHARQLRRTKRKSTSRKRSFNLENSSDRIIRSLVNRFREKEILEYIFGPNIHLEIVQRSTDVLLFLIDAEALNSTDLDKIWMPVAGNQHQSIVHGVFNVLNEISDRLGLEHRENLFRKLKVLPMSLYDTQTYLLIKQLILSMVETAHSSISIRDSKVNQVFYEAQLLLWRILRDSSVPLSLLMNAEATTPTAASTASASSLIDQDIIQGVNQLLNNILQYGPHEEKREEFLEKCIEDLKSHHPATVWALRVIMRIITPPFPTTTCTAMDYLRHLIFQIGLPNLFLEDLTHWTNTVKSLYDRRNSSISMDIDRMSPSGSASPLVGLSPTRAVIIKDQLHGRLQFLQWMGNSETVSFFTSTEQTDIIWDCLIAEPIGVSERDEAFQCLETIEEYNYFINHFFHNRLPQLDVRYFSEQALKYAKNCLLKVNNKNDRLRMNLPSQIYLQGDLIGTQLIWNIALCAEVESVGKEAIAFLVHLYMNTEPNLPDSVSLARKHRETVVDKCVANLFAAANGLSSSLSFSPSVGNLSIESLDQRDDAHDLGNYTFTSRKTRDALMFKRCLEMLKYFMDYFDTKYMSTKSGQMLVRRHGMLNDGKMITIKVKLSQGAETKEMEFPMHTSETILALRHKIGAKIKLSQPGVIRLITGGKEYHHDSNGSTFQELKINDGAVFICIRRRSEVEDAQETEKLEPKANEEVNEADMPVNILSKYVDQFFVMLQLEEEYASQIWDLLMRLPTNTRILNSLKTLEAPVEWNTLLDSQSPFRLLYALQIVDWLLRGGDEQLSAFEWSRKFMENGGHDHLLAILIKRDQTTNDSENALIEHQKSVIKRACLGLLLKVIDYFISSENSTMDGQFFMRIDKSDLISRLLEIVGKCIDPSLKQVDEDVIIIKYANKLLYCLCMRDESALQSLFAYPGLGNWLLMGLVQCQSEEARKELANLIEKFCIPEDIELGLQETTLSSSPHSRSLEFFLQLLVSILPKLEQHVYTCKEYFGLLGSLLKSMIAPINFDVGKLFDLMIHHIKNHPIKEVAYHSEESHSNFDDTLIIGLMKTLTVLMAKYPKFKSTTPYNEGLIDMIFDDCLFEIPTMEYSGCTYVPPKCKFVESRTAAMELLLELVKGCPENFIHLTNLLLRQLDRGDQLNDNWNYCPQICTKANSGYVGLQNLGATCYVNSIVQQFFMNPSFRNGIFSAPVRDENKDESLLYQLQVVFGHLQESQKKAYEATPFCQSYKDYDGGPMNVAVQMDVDEYFNGLFDRLETSVSGTSQEMLFKNHFGGTLVQQIKSRECEHVSEREDPIFNIQCEVKNKKNIEESLQLYVEGEIMDGDNKYYCEMCGRKVDAIKRACIKTLPNNLILHLKRFDFDMESLKRVKINEQFEFPDRINMEPYTLDYLMQKESGQLEELNSDDTNKSQFEYQLVGVLVHTGSADSGHYYSFIKERKPLHPDGSNEQKWYQFNDSNVEGFNPKDIPKCCYGGSEYMTNWDPNTQKNVTRTFAKPYSAYMLFYERCDDSQNDNNFVSGKEATSKIPEDIYTGIWHENIGFLQDKNIFDVGYFRLMWNVLHSVDFDADNRIIIDNDEYDLTFRTIQLASEFVLGTFCRAKENLELKEWIDFLKTLFQTHLIGCRWFIKRFIEKHPNYAQQIFMSCYVPEVREHVVDLVLFVLRVLRQGDPNVYGLVMTTDHVIDENHDTRMSVDSTSQIAQSLQTNNSLIVEFCDALFFLLNNASHYWRNFDQYFCLLSQIAHLGIPEKVYMINCGLVGELVKLFLLDEISPLKGRKRRMGDKFSLPTFRNLLATLAILITACDAPCTVEQTTEISGTEARLKLNEEDLRLILQRSETDDELIFFMKQIRDNVDLASSRDIFTHFATNDKGLSEQLIEQLFRAADSYPVDHHVKAYLEIVYVLTQIKDFHLEFRVRHAIQYVLKLSNNHPNTPSVAGECLRFIEYLIVSDIGSYVQDLLSTHMGQWLPSFLLDNPYETIRQHAESLCDILIFHRVKETLDETHKEAIRKLYEVLLKNLDRCESCWKITHHRKELYGWRLSNYFRVLTKCIITNEDKLAFIPYFDKFITCFISVDNVRHDSDMDKKEMIIFWHKVCSGCPENVALYVKNPNNIIEAMHMYYVSINHNAENIAYNQATLPKYYGIILMACQQSPEYHAIWMDAANFTWALHNMIWGDFYDDHKTDELIELLKISADKSVEFRIKCWDSVLSVGQSVSARKISYYLKLHTFLYRETIEDFLIFCKYYGLDYFSQYIFSVKEKNPSDENLFQCLDVLLCYFKKVVAASSRNQNDQELQSSFKSWTHQKNFVRTLLSFLHPNTENQIYIRVTGKSKQRKNIFCILLEIEYISDAVSDILDAMVSSHAEWNKKTSHIEGDLLLVFGGNHSLFNKYQLLPDLKTGGTNKSSFNYPSIHVYKPFLHKLLPLEIQSLQEELYSPYLTIVKHAIDAGCRLHEYDKVVQLCSLIAVEMMEFQGEFALYTLFDLFDKTSENDQILQAFINIHVARIVEYILNSNLSILLKLSQQQLKSLKSLTQFVKSRKVDLIQPIISKHIQQLVINVKVLKERLEANDVKLVGSILEQLVAVLQVLDITLTPTDFMSPSAEDPLWHAFIESLEKLKEYLLSSDQQSQFESFAVISEKIILLVDELKSQVPSAIITTTTSLVANEEDIIIVTENTEDESMKEDNSSSNNEAVVGSDNHKNAGNNSGDDGGVGVATNISGDVDENSGNLQDQQPSTI